MKFKTKSIFIFNQLNSFSKHIGRRKFLISSGLGMSICTFCAAIYTYYENTLIKSDFIPLICVLGYVCCSSLGVLVIPWTLIGELLPIEVRLFISICSSSSSFFDLHFPLLV